MATAAKLDVTQDARQVVRAFKRAERANRDAAKTFAQFIERIELLGFKFEIEIDGKGSQPNGTDRDRNENS